MIILFISLSLIHLYIKNTVAFVFWLIDSSSSYLEVLELKKNAALDPELAWLFYSEELD